VIILASSAFGQSFEVASIKPAAPQEPHMRMVRMGSDPGRINYEGVTLKNLLARAYNVKDYQITGPDWLTSERYDVTAKLPECADRDQVPQMLQALLNERFKMSIRHEEKELPVYDLVVAKGGPKLKPSQGLKPEMLPPGVPKTFMTGTPVPAPDAPEQRTNPCPTPPAGKPAAAAPPRIGGSMFRMNDGHLELNNVTMPGLANNLSNMLGRPVLDKTGIEGNYDVTLDVDPTEFMANMKRNMAGAVMIGPGGEASRADAGPAPESNGGSVFTAVQQLGLKLEGRKAPLEMIVVDHADKVPTEN
jgi:uncharacterized protein (TIGR03435 family)